MSKQEALLLIEELVSRRINDHRRSKLMNQLNELLAEAPFTALLNPLQRYDICAFVAEKWVEYDAAG